MSDAKKMLWRIDDKDCIAFHILVSLMNIKLPVALDRLQSIHIRSLHVCGQLGEAQ